jgi:hypothetical protein
VLDLVRAQHDSAPGATGAASGSGG